MLTAADIEQYYCGIEMQMAQYARMYYYKFKDRDEYNLFHFSEINIRLFSKEFNKQTVKMMGKMREGHFPDRHKMIATGLKSFIHANVFSFAEEEYNHIKKKLTADDLKKPISINILCPNEMYALDMISFFTNQYARFKQLPEYNLRIPDHIFNYVDNTCHNYVTDLFMLLRGYRQEKLEFAVQELAHIIFFLEMGYDMKAYDLKEKYYTD